MNLPAATLVFTKRQRIVLTAIILPATLAITLYLHAGIIGSALVIVLTYLAVIWSLAGDFKREEWLIIPLYAVLLSLVVAAWVAALTTSTTVLVLELAGYGIATYILLLGLNILNLATVKPIPLARTAITALSAITFCLSFALFHILQLRQLPLWWWAVGVACTAMLIAWPLIWASVNDQNRLIESFKWSLLTGLVLGQLGVLTGFWPASFATCIFLSGMLFIILGLLHHQQRYQLTLTIKRQYLMLGILISFLYFILTSW